MNIEAPSQYSKNMITKQYSNGPLMNSKKINLNVTDLGPQTSDNSQIHG